MSHLGFRVPSLANCKPSTAEGLVTGRANPQGMTTEQQASPDETTHHHEASRTLVKSPPELWAECSDAGSLARHLGEFGEIRITRLEPESNVAWEGEHASGTVRIEPSAWGTRVTLTAQVVVEPPGGVEPPVAVEPPGVVEPKEGVVSGALVEEAAGPADEVPADPVVVTDSTEEATDATVEETLEEPDPALAADPGRPHGRWRRLRALFKRRAEGVEDELDTAAPPAAVEAVVAPVVEAAALPEPVEAVPPPVQAAPPPVDADPEPVAPEPPNPEAGPDLNAGAILTAALDSLGQAHHRPFSRA